MGKDWIEDISLLHTQMQQKDLPKGFSDEMLTELLRFRVKMLEEELNEIREAKSAEDVVDGLIDLAVFVVGTLDHFGVDGYKAWNAIQRANMSKHPGIKPQRPNPFGLPDMIKPQGWQGPDHTGNHGLLSKVKFPVDHD